MYVFEIDKIINFYRVISKFNRPKYGLSVNCFFLKPICEILSFKKYKNSDINKLDVILLQTDFIKSDQLFKMLFISCIL